MIQEIEQRIREMYVEKRMSGDAIAKIIGLNRKTVYTAILRMGIRRPIGGTQKRYTFDESFFETIDSHAKAQMLGFWYADGCVSHHGRPISEITLAMQDVKYLEDMKVLLKSDQKIRFHRRATPNHQDQCRLYLCGSKPRDQLVRLGCVPRKSLILTFPTLDQVPTEFVSSFMLGFFEGDGGLCLEGSPNRPEQIRGTFSIASTPEFCQSYGSILQTNCGVNFRLNRCQSTGNTHNLVVGGNRMVLRVLDFLYSNAAIRMERKWGLTEILRARVKDIDARHGDRYSRQSTALAPWPRQPEGSNMTIT